MFEHIPVPGEDPLAARMEYASVMGTVLPLGETGFAFVSGLETEAAPDQEEGQPLVGIIGRKACMAIGNEACVKTCQLAVLRGAADPSLLHSDTLSNLQALDRNPTKLLEEDPTACADNNLLRAISHLGLRPNNALMVGVGVADNLGFLDDPTIREKIARNPHGWYELPGFNAFFARNHELLPVPADITEGNAVLGAGVVDAEAENSLGLLGVRLADSGYVVVTMKDADGQAVTGIIHSTRTNMPGRKFRKEYGGIQQSFIRYVISEAMGHYGVQSPDDVSIRMVAAVGPEEWQKRYPSARKLEEQLPGWAEEGLIVNASNPAWLPGMEPVGADGERDVLYPQYPSKVRAEIVEAAALLGIKNVAYDGYLNPGKPYGGIVHSSDNRKRMREAQGQPVGARDLYAVVMA
jgi:hypothetical protein